MRRNLRKLASGTVIVAASVAAFAVPRSAAPTQSSDTVVSADADQAPRRKCRWVWRHGLVCETKTSTVNP
jgi:hypothetical protein